MRTISALLLSFLLVGCEETAETQPSVLLDTGDYAPNDPGFDENGCLLEGASIVTSIESDQAERTLTIPEGSLFGVTTPAATVSVADDGSFSWKVSAVYESSACEGDVCYDCVVEVRGAFDGKIVDSTSFDATDGVLSVESQAELEPACETLIKEQLAAGYSKAAGCKSTFSTRMSLSDSF